MDKRDTFLLLALATCVFLIVALGVSSPGYMDAAYYYATAQQLITGEGFSQPFIWNYLDDPIALPHPSHTYWMPLTSVVSAIAMYLFGDTFRAAQLPQLLFALLLPLFVVSIAKRFGADRRMMWCSGVIAIFSGFYLPYFITTDSFTFYAWIGSAVLILAADGSRHPDGLRWFFVGLLSGLGYLTRADGLLLLIPIVAAVLWSGAQRVKAVIMLSLGFFICVGPWFIRNLSITGHIFPIGARRTLWLLSYNEIFSYPANILTPERWWQAGIGELILTRLWSLGVIFQRFIAEIGLIFLWPFMIIGVYLLRKKREVKLAMIYLVTLVVLMSIVYPFAGAYGGFFHSGTGLLPILWAIVPMGLDRAIEWGARIRKWDVRESKRVFGIGAIVLAVSLSLGLTYIRVIGVSATSPRWQEFQHTYQQIGEEMQEIVQPDDVVAVNNPPAFFIATGLRAVVIPNGSPETLKSVIEQFQVRWLILDVNHPEGLADIYAGEISPSWMDLELTIQDANGEDIQLWKVTFTEIPP